PGKYYWLYLRRPANPLDPNSAKVVVDSIRFPYTDAGGVGQTTIDPVTGKDKDTIRTTPNQDLYSLQRLQPYRGGQDIPPDRYYAGLAELLLVPGTAPGLFTKMFVESPPPLRRGKTPTPSGDKYPYSQPPKKMPADAPDPNPNPDPTSSTTVYVPNAFGNSP